MQNVISRKIVQVHELESSETSWKLSKNANLAAKRNSEKYKKRLFSSARIAEIFSTFSLSELITVVILYFVVTAYHPSLWVKKKGSWVECGFGLHYQNGHTEGF